MKPTALLYEVTGEAVNVLTMGEPKAVLAKALCLHQALKGASKQLKDLGLPWTQGTLQISDITDIPQNKREELLETRTKKGIEWITAKTIEITHAWTPSPQSTLMLENDYRLTSHTNGVGITTHKNAPEESLQEVRENSNPELARKWTKVFGELPTPPPPPLYEEKDSEPVKKILQTLQERGTVSVETVIKILGSPQPGFPIPSP